MIFTQNIHQVACSQIKTIHNLRKAQIVATLIGLIFVAIATHTDVQAGWSIQTIDSGGGVGYCPSIAIDSNNHIHISYYFKGNIKYAKWDGSSWSIQTVASSGGYGVVETSIKVDTNNNPHIAFTYSTSTDCDLKYARWTGTSWDVQTVDSVGYVGADPSLALDKSNNPHIAYRKFDPSDNNNDRLKYAKWTGSSWNTEIVDSTTAGWQPSIILDKNNYPCIAYYDYTNGYLKYAKWTGSSWSRQTIDSTGDTGWSSSIALDTNNYPHISYYHWIDGDSLKYARWTGSSWSIQTVTSPGGSFTGKNTSIRLDSNNYPHIAFSMRNVHDIKYAKWTGSSWSIETIGSTADWSEAVSIGLDSSGIPHISYMDCDLTQPYTELKYAKWVPPQIDLIITNVDAPSSATERDTINVSYMMKNQGNTLAGSFYIYFYLSLDTTINPSQDTKFGECYVSALSAGPGITDITSCALPSGLTGSYYVGAIIDATGSVSESNENNNTGYDPTPMDISPAPPGPDLVVVSIDAPSSATAGDSVNVWNTIKNEGDVSTGSFYIYFYLSTSLPITTWDTKIGERYVSSLSAGASSSASSYLTLPSGVTGSYYVGAIVDAIGSVSESNENNNTGYDPTPIDISPGPNLQLSHSYLDFGEIPKGETKTKTFTISNSGAGTLSGTITTDRSWISASPGSFDGNSVTASVTVYTDTLEVWKTYTGTVTVDSNGGKETVTVSIVPTCVKSYPNPYSLSSGKLLTFWGTGVPHATIKIYTLSGELVKTLKETEGQDKITWDGRNEDGERVVRGIYFFTAESPREKNRGKFTVVK